MEQEKNQSTQPHSPKDRNISPKKRRISAKRKQQIVLCLLRGESLEILSRKNNVTAAAITEWCDKFLAGGETALKADQRAQRDDEIKQLHAKLGQVTMENELLNQKNDRLESDRPLASRRSKR